jgi:catechol 2,3-dioxygenase-like lactoylglutathione lyase family enzyme
MGSCDGAPVFFDPHVCSPPPTAGLMGPEMGFELFVRAGAGGWSTTGGPPASFEARGRRRLKASSKEEHAMAIQMPADWSFGATIPSGNLQETRKFYEGVLGCEVVREDEGGIIYRSGDTYFSLYLTPFGGKAEHTLGGFLVKSLDEAVADLRAKGVTFEDYDIPEVGIKTVDGIATIPNGMRFAWFKDPEGNILSLTSMPELP